MEDMRFTVFFGEKRSWISFDTYLAALQWACQHAKDMPAEAHTIDIFYGAMMPARRLIDEATGRKTPLGMYYGEPNGEFLNRQAINEAEYRKKEGIVLETKGIKDV